MKLGAMAVTLPGSGLATQALPVDLPEPQRILFGLRTGLSPVEHPTLRINFDTGNAGIRPAERTDLQGTIATPARINPMPEDNSWLGYHASDSTSVLKLQAVAVRRIISAIRRRPFRGPTGRRLLIHRRQAA